MQAHTCLASASFLAALHPQITLSHLSPVPISPNLFPNVQPVLVPTVSSSAAFRTLPPNFYNTVTCLSMPALFPSTEIPPFLRHINRCLAPGGALHLTLIDPQPVSSSMGPILRQWFVDNLLLNLERMFRTTYPSATFPDWLTPWKGKHYRDPRSSRSAPNCRVVRWEPGNQLYARKTRTSQPYYQDALARGLGSFRSRRSMVVG